MSALDARIDELYQQPLAGFLGPGAVGGQADELPPVPFRFVIATLFVQRACQVIMHVRIVAVIGQGAAMPLDPKTATG